MHLSRATFAAILLGALSAGTPARPVVIEPAARLVNPEPVNWPAFGAITATNGEWLLVLGGRYDFNTDLVERTVFLYRRAGGQWQFQGLLDQSSRMSGSYLFPSKFALQGDRALIELDGTTKSWRIVNGTWQEGAIVTGASITEDIELDGENFVTTTGDCAWDAFAHDSDGAGGWTRTFLDGQPRGCDDEFWGGEADRLGNFIIVATADTFDLEDQEVPIFEKLNGTWQRRIAIKTPASNNEFNEGVALVPQASAPVAGIEAILGAAEGAYSYDLWGRPSPHRLQAADAYQAATIFAGFNGASSTIEYAGGLIFVRERSADRGVNVINVSRGDHDAGYEHVAVLAADHGGSINEQFDAAVNADGSITVITSDSSSGGGASNLNNTGDIYVFNVPANPATPAARYDDFQDGVADGWSAVGTTRFSVTAGSNRVFRQADISGEARALLDGTSWKDQAIEADITPTAFGCADCWVGLVTRYQDAGNYYYVTLRNSGQVHLRRMVNGNYVELARANVPVTQGRGQRVRLESVGSVHKVYLDGTLVLDVDDETLAGPGRAGITMYRSRADYDHVVVTPSPQFTIFRNNFASYAGNWRFSGSGQWQLTNGVYAQNSIGAEARALMGPPLTDQVVRARIRPIAYAAATGSQERWSGLVARHVDDSNYYYVTLRTSNQLSLRKLINGSIVTLGTVPLAVSLNSTYDVRLEAVGGQLRVFVNGQLRLQAHDGSHARGRGGLMTYKAAVQYDDYLAYQP